MAQLFHREIRNHHGQFFTFIWFLGIVAGYVLHGIAGFTFQPWMRGIFSSSVSIVGLLRIAFLPFLFSAFAVFICLPGLLYPICFVKSLVFSAVSFGLWNSFGSAGWLVWLLLMFTDVMSLPVLYWYSRRYVSGLRSFSGAEFLMTSAVLALIGSIDYCYISPFLALLSF